MAILVNIAMGEVNGIYEQAIIRGLSTEPEDMEVITTKNAAISMIVSGMAEVLISSTFDAVEPIAL